MPSSDARSPLLLMNNWLTMVSSPAGISSQVMTRRIWLIPERSSDLTSVNFDASDAN